MKIMIKDAAYKVSLIILLILVSSNFAVFGQDGKSKNQLAQSSTITQTASKETSQEMLEARTSKTTKINTPQRIEKSSEFFPSQSSANYLPENSLTSKQSGSLSNFDYLQKAKEYERDAKSNRRKQKTVPQEQIEETQSQAEWERRQETQNSAFQQWSRDTDTAAEQNKQNGVRAGQGGNAAKTGIFEQLKQSWIVLAFEILQMIVFLLIASKKGIARKYTVAMTASLFICLSLFLCLSSFVDGTQLKAADNLNSQQGSLRFWVYGAVLLGLFSFCLYFINKVFAYIIVASLPKSFAIRLMSIVGTGVALIVLYSSLALPGSHIYLSGVLCGIAVIIIGGIDALIKEARHSDNDNLHGSARFATKEDIREFEKSAEAGAFILASADPNANHRKVSLPRTLSIMHGLILGGSGTGKSRGYFMPNCAAVENTSLVVTDPKSELWKYTSGYHNKALRFAPTEPESSHCFNWIPLCSDARISELCARAIMSSGNTQNTDQFWIDAETAFLSAIFSHTSTMKYPTPLTAYRLFTRQKPEALMEQLLNSPSFVAREQAIIFEQTDSKIKGAIVPAIAARMQFMRDPNIQLFTSAQLEAPNFGQLRRVPTAVYWCLREQDIARLRPLTSLFFTVLLEQIACEEVLESELAVPITMMLDEFANIGKIPDFEVTQSLARGRGVALWLGVQSLSQLNQTYGNHAAQTIISNCTTKIALHGLDYQTAEYISKSLGEQTISHSSRSFSVSLTGGSMGSHEAKHRRPLLTPDEVMRIGENEAIARTSNKYPMRLYKGYYNEPMKTYPVTQSLTKVYVEEAKVVEDLAL